MESVIPLRTTDDSEQPETAGLSSEIGSGARIRTVNLAVNSPTGGCPEWSVGVHRVPLRIRRAGDRVRHVTHRTAVFGGIRDTVVTLLAPLRMNHGTATTLP